MFFGWAAGSAIYPRDVITIAVVWLRVGYLVMYDAPGEHRGFNEAKVGQQAACPLFGAWWRIRFRGALAHAPVDNDLDNDDA